MRQLATTDCGAACIAMVLGRFGRPTTLSEVREVMRAGRDGVTARAIVEAAAHFGLRARGVRVDLNDLEALPSGAILHWEFQHFVVFERASGAACTVLDPASGRRSLSWGEVSRSLTGVAILCEPGDEFSALPAPRSRAGRYLRWVSVPGYWGRIVSLSLILQVVALVVPGLTGALVDRVIPRGDVHLLTMLCLGAGTMLVFQLVSSLVRGHLLLELRTRVDVELSLTFLERMMRLPFTFFQRHTPGDLMLRLGSSAAVREQLTGGTLSALFDGTLVLLYLCLLFGMHAGFASVVVMMGILQVMAFVVVGRKQRALAAEELAVQSRLSGYQVEMLAGVETLKASGHEERGVTRWTDLYVDVLNASLERGRLSLTVDAIMGTVRMSFPVVTMALGAELVLTQSMSLGTMLALTALAGGFLGPVANLVSTATQLQLVGTHFERLDEVLDATPEQPQTQIPRIIPILEGRILLDRVTFRYAPASPDVLKDVSLAIEPGSSVAIVGRSGVGKSTLAHLLLGIHEPTSGSIRFDDIDSRAVELRALRRQFGVVHQRPYIFSGTIRSNIAFFDESIPLESIRRAASLAGIDEDIMAMPMAYETVVADGGASLSGGQRQRIALARALVREPKVLLLDEATSALDATTERHVQAALAGLRCTRIVIAHRLSTVMSADTIVVVDAGRIVEQGTHAELVAAGGCYASLVDAQLEPAYPSMTETRLS